MRSLYLPDLDAFIRWHEIAGDDPPVLYLPGLSMPCVANFLSVATHPQMPRRRSVLVDYLGAGFSDHPADFGHSLEEHVTTVAQVLDHDGGGPWSVVGHSMGGTVAIALAMARPDLVRKLIVSEGNLTPGGGAKSSQIAATDRAAFTDEAFFDLLERRRHKAAFGHRYADYFAGAWAHTDPAGLHGSAHMLVNLPEHFKKSFLQLPLPRTYIYGEIDYPGDGGPVRPDAPDPAELTNHGVTTAVVASAGHNMMLDNLVGYVGVVRDALTGANPDESP